MSRAPTTSHPSPAVAGLFLGAALLGLLPLAASAPAGEPKRADDGPAKTAGPPPTVYALVHVARLRPTLLRDPREQVRADDAEFEDDKQVQMVLLTSRRVLSAAVKDPKVADLPALKGQADPAGWLEQRVRGKYLNDSGVLRISVSAGSAEDQAALVNAVTKAYLSTTQARDQVERRARLDPLRAIAAEYEQKAEAKRRVLKELAEVAGGSDRTTAAARRELDLKVLSAVQTELLQVQSELRRAKVELAVRQKRDGQPNKPPAPGAGIDEAVRRDSTVEKLLRDIAQKETYLARLKETTQQPDKEPAYRRMRESLDALKDALAKRQDEVRVVVVQQGKQRAQDQARVEQEQLKARVQFLEELGKVLTRELEARAATIARSQRTEVNVERERDELAQAADIARRIRTQVEVLAIESQAPPRVTLLQEAQAPGR